LGTLTGAENPVGTVAFFSFRRPSASVVSSVSPVLLSFYPPFYLLAHPFLSTTS
jgi:hypothetical protein